MICVEYVDTCVKILYIQQSPNNMENNCQCLVWSSPLCRDIINRISISNAEY